MLLATPGDPASPEIVRCLQNAQLEAEIETIPSDDDVLIYRERVNLPLADLEQLGPVAQDAYQQMTSTDHFTPHSRCDVAFK